MRRVVSIVSSSSTTWGVVPQFCGTACYSSVMERGNDWSVRLTAAVGKRVARHRDDQGLTTAALSALCEKSGLKLDLHSSTPDSYINLKIGR